MKTQLQHIKYDLYLITLLVLTFFSFTGHIQAYLMPLFVGISVLFILGGSSIFYIIPIPFFIQMSWDGMRDNVQITTLYGIVIFVLIIIDLLKNRTITRGGRLIIPLALLSLLSIVTHVNSPDLFTTFAGFIQVFVILGLYFYFINTMDPSDDNIRYISKMIMYMSVLVSLEMMYIVYESGELAIEIIKQRKIDLGWENLNVIIYANLLSIPLIAYLIHESKVKIFYMVFALLSMIGIFLTLSRSSVLTVAVFVVLLVPTMFILSNQKWWLIIQGVAFVTVILIGVYYIETNYLFFSDYITALQDRDIMNFDNRIELLYVAWDQLKLHPIIGSGGVYSSRIHLQDYGALNYHNTIAQATTLGGLGLLGFIYLFYEKTKIIMLSKSSIKWFALILIYVTAFVNGMFQPMYFYTSYMVWLFMILAAIEVTIKSRNKETKEA